MDPRTIQVASVVEAVQKAVSAGARSIDITQAARLAAIPETDLSAVVAEVAILLRSVLKGT
jgi:hypothetical protein